jgi:glycosyltransferase involved in cell wall biosynthesis
MVEQLRELRDQHGFDVTAIVSGESGGLIEKLRIEEIPYHSHDFGFGGIADIWALPSKIIGLAKLFRRERFDIVQTHLFHSMVIGRLAAWLADVPVRLAMIAGPFHLEAPIPRWIDRWTCWMDNVLIGSCKFTNDLYRSMGVRNERLALVYYGPDEEKFDLHETKPAAIREEYGWAPNTPLIGMIAYFYPPLYASRWTPPALHNRAIKGHEYLIRAVPTILAEFPDAKVLLVGSGWGDAGDEHMRAMQNLVASLGLEHSVIFTGFRSDVHNILRTLSVSVQPSLNENLGGTIEALLMECPLVAASVGGMVDSVLDGQTGVLVEPADADSLATGILRLLRRPDQAQAFAKNGRQLMLERFTLSRTAADLNRLYRLHLEQRREDHLGYRLWVTVGRAFVGTPVVSTLALRLMIVESYLLPAWEAGWRPWNMQKSLRKARLAPYYLYGWVRKCLTGTSALRAWDRAFPTIKTVLGIGR